MFNDYETGLAENSSKFLAFFKLLEETILVGERMLLFSQSLATLDLIEDFLHQRTIPSKNSANPPEPRGFNDSRSFDGKSMLNS